MIELIFCLAFTVHNIEEALFLPRWSKEGGSFHPPVGSRQFAFAVTLVTLIGYGLSLLHYCLHDLNALVSYLYRGFVFIMCLNAFFPHLLATLVLRRYMPGTLTALCLVVPLGLYQLITSGFFDAFKLEQMLILLVEIAATIGLLKLLLKIGEKWEKS